MSSHFDIIIIGAGFAGASTAYHLSQDFSGSILLLERESTYGQHASGKNAAMLRQALVDLRAAEWVQETRMALLHPPQDWKHPDAFQQNGSLLFGSKTKVLRLGEIAKSLSIEADLYPHGKFPPNLDPQLRVYLDHAEYQSLLHFPGDGVIDIRALLENYLHAARRRGVCIQTHSEVRNIQKIDNHWKVECEKEIFFANVVVNAAGAWANQVVKTAGFAIEEMESYRRHLYISDPMKSVAASWPILWNIEQEFYLRPESNGLLLSPGDEEKHPPSEAMTDPRMADLLAIKLQRYFPALEKISIRRGWACLRTKLSSGLSYIDWDRKFPGFYWVSGLGGHGVSSSFGVGRAAARDILHFFGVSEGNFNRKSVTQS
jgi:D-arginine dehydrogenase